MATNQSVPKSELFARLRKVFTDKESGMLTLLTDSKKSVLMRFSNGELTSARCRSWDIENTIEALLETENVKYSYIASVVENKPTLLAAGDFMMMIDPGGPGLEVEEVLPKEKQSTAKTESPGSNKTKENLKKDDQAGRDVDRAIAAKMNFF